MNRHELILATLAAAGENASFTPVQVQKLFFLIDREASHLVGGPHFNFEPYDYGPFDRAVYAELDLLHLAGKVEITFSGRYRMYSLTAEGFAEGLGILSRLRPPAQQYLRDASHWVLRLNFRQLVSAIYQKYPDMRANSIFQ